MGSSNRWFSLWQMKSTFKISTAIWIVIKRARIDFRIFTKGLNILKCIRFILLWFLFTVFNCWWFAKLMMAKPIVHWLNIMGFGSFFSPIHSFFTIKRIILCKCDSWVQELDAAYVMACLWFDNKCNGDFDDLEIFPQPFPSSSIHSKLHFKPLFLFSFTIFWWSCLSMNWRIGFSIHKCDY